jgi:hypothetical protein
LNSPREPSALTTTQKGIALSGFGHDDIRRSREAVYTEHLIKPVDFKMLDTTLKRIAG